MDFQAFNSIYCKIFRQNGMEKYVKAEYIEAFYRLTERMLEVNAHMNLTAITDPEGVVLKHYVDSLTVADRLSAGAKVVDIGCGAGFPTLPLAIVRPDLELLALDSTAKRIDYVAQTAKMLGLDHVRAIACRAEDGAAPNGPYRERFDVAISRAVANLPVLAELCLPYVALGGRMIAMKAAQAKAEAVAASAGIAKLGGGELNILPLTLVAETGEEERNLVIIDKIGKTPKIYPRNYAQIKKKPL